MNTNSAMLILGGGRKLDWPASAISIFKKWYCITTTYVTSIFYFYMFTSCVIVYFTLIAAHVCLHVLI